MTLKPIFRLLLAAGMLYAGVAHFRNPAPFIRIVPDVLPAHYALVLVSGVCEIAGGVGLLIPRLRKYGGWGLIALYVVVFPANVKMAVEDIPVDGVHRPALLWLRLPLQAVLIWWAWRVSRPDNPQSVPGGNSSPPPNV